MMNKINPRTLGTVGNRANLENDSIAKYAKQINKSGPVNATQSRIEQQNSNLVSTPDYEQMLPTDLEMRNNQSLRKN